MNTAVLSTYDIDVSDVEYLRHGDRALLARVYKPKGEGPFPLVIDLHGGAWCKKDRLADEGTDAPLAKSGVTVVSLDFRMPPDGTYPASVQDINYAIRWAKSKAQELKIDPNRVAVLGVSSGGHQAMLTAMRPRDARYSSLPSAGNFDASVQAVVLCWPVIDPLGRYEYAKENLTGKLEKHAKEWIACHDRFWGSEAAMADVIPTRALERGE
jgi:acetyl esterase/lipase